MANHKFYYTHSIYFREIFSKHCKVFMYNNTYKISCSLLASIPHGRRVAATPKVVRARSLARRWCQGMSLNFLVIPLNER